MAFLVIFQKNLENQLLTWQKNYFCRMRKLLVGTLVLGFLFAGQSCKQNQSSDPSQVANSQESEYNKHLKVYKQAMKIKDFQTAIIALNYMHAADSSYSKYTDTLITLYATARLYNSVIQLGEDLIKQFPEKDTIRELVAMSNNSMGNYNKAFADFEMLHNKDADPTYLYNMAKIKYLLKQPSEARKLYKSVIDDTASMTRMVEFPSVNGSLQKVALVAGCYMQLANIDADEQKLQSAVANLQRALKISPGFETAQYSLQQLQEYQAQLKYQQQLQKQQRQLPQGLR